MKQIECIGGPLDGLRAHVITDCVCYAWAPEIRCGGIIKHHGYGYGLVAADGIEHFVYVGEVVLNKKSGAHFCNEILTPINFDFEKGKK